MTKAAFRKYSSITVFAILLGLVSGLFNALFGRLLLVIGSFRQEYFFYLIPFLAAAGLLIVFLYDHWGRQVQNGMTLVFEVAHGSKEPIPKRLIPLIMVTTWLTHLFGGSAGREGVAVQIGAAVAYQLKRYLPDKQAASYFIVIGMAAGFAGLFQTPLAASFFAIEVLAVGRYYWRALLPSLLAAYTASMTSYFLGLEKFQHLINSQFEFSPSLLLKGVLISLIFAAIGNFFALFLQKTKGWLKSLIPNSYLRIALIGLVLSGMMILLDGGRYAGLGTNLIEASLSGKSIYAYDWILKTILTVLTLAAGFQGGEVTPLFAIGASAGAWLASILGLPFELTAALGYVAVFGTATNTLLAPIFIGIEVFGWQNAPIFMFVVAIAHYFNQKQSIYSAQKRR